MSANLSLNKSNPKLVAIWLCVISVTLLCCQVARAELPVQNDERPVFQPSINPEIYKLQHEITVLKNALRLAEEKGHQSAAGDSVLRSPDDFAEVPRQHWTHSPRGILICVKVMAEGECFEVVKKTLNKIEKQPFPWYSPQQYLDYLMPEASVEYLYMDHYPPQGRLSLYYRIKNANLTKMSN